ncbi:hypothetical protein FA95DRAFT_1605181 [Auriscalpium vulgare]|uniref:Uncharacterized protein n=1 Tax=Auriscalpium vulgare TaxID=40419 RepID=A0ACB8RXB9_9AGAM|nr:hypothetical protein FA95DRAFT_1605181 [Auriscalpium vulgare]
MPRAGSQESRHSDSPGDASRKSSAGVSRRTVQLSSESRKNSAEMERRVSSVNGPDHETVQSSPESHGTDPPGDGFWKNSAETAQVNRPGTVRSSLASSWTVPFDDDLNKPTARSSASSWSVPYKDEAGSRDISRPGCFDVIDKTLEPTQSDALHHIIPENPINSEPQELVNQIRADGVKDNHPPPVVAAEPSRTTSRRPEPSLDTVPPGMATRPSEPITTSPGDPLKTTQVMPKDRVDPAGRSEDIHRLVEVPSDIKPAMQPHEDKKHPPPASTDAQKGTSKSDSNVPLVRDERIHVDRSGPVKQSYDADAKRPVPMSSADKGTVGEGAAPEQHPDRGQFDLTQPPPVENRAPFTTRRTNSSRPGGGAINVTPSHRISVANSPIPKTSLDQRTTTSIDRLHYDVVGAKTDTDGVDQSTPIHDAESKPGRMDSGIAIARDEEKYETNRAMLDSLTSIDQTGSLSAPKIMRMQTGPHIFEHPNTQQSATALAKVGDSALPLPKAPMGSASLAGAALAVPKPEETFTAATWDTDTDSDG